MLTIHLLEIAADLLSVTIGDDDISVFSVILFSVSMIPATGPERVKGIGQCLSSAFLLFLWTTKNSLNFDSKGKTAI